ncbi:MAG TPA: hypothetical protein EYQ08_02790 [Planctomycetes bacterium]|nr:hypothetical protein [Planctomycetota bacterium]
MRHLLVTSFLMVLVLMTTGVFAQDYVLTVSNGSIPNNGSGDLTVNLDNNGGELQGWSYGACNDTAFLTCTGVVNGSTVATVNDGGTPDFNQMAVFDEGFTAGVVICFIGCATLTNGTGYELNIATYDCTAEGSTSVSFCDTLGSPAVATVVVVDGASIVPVQNSGDVECIGVPDPEYTYAAGNASAGYNPADGNASTSVDITIAETDNSGLGAPFPNDTQGFSMGLGNSSEVVATAVNLTLPFEADFGETSIYPEGWTAGVVYSFTGGAVLAFPSATTVISVDYETGGSMAGNEDGAIASLTWDDGLGSPAVANVVVVGGGSLTAAQSNGSIALNPVVTSDWIRGDANSDSVVNIGDVIWMISELFTGGAASSCSISSDANDDGSHDLGDPSYVIQYRFIGGPMPVAPFPGCGQVDGQTPEDCEGSSCSG